VRSIDRVVGAGTAGLLVCLAGCSTGDGRSDQTPDAAAPRYASAGPWIPGFLADMSDAEKVGQLFVPSAPNQPDALKLIDKYHVGGFVLSTGEAKTPAQTARLADALQGRSDLPLLIGLADNATVSYLTPLPGDQALAADCDPDDIRAIDKVSYAEQRAVGLTPDYDQGIHPARGRKLRRDGAVQAVKDGADELIDPPDLPRSYKAVLKAVQKGRISQHRLDEAVTRILHLKQVRGMFGDIQADPAKAAAQVGTPGNRAVARTVAVHAVTLVRNDPASGASRPLLPLGDVTVYVTGAAAGGVADALRQAGLHITKSLHKADVAVLASRGSGQDVGWRVRYLHRSAPVVVLALGKPDALADAKRATAAVAAYGDDAAALAAAAGVLTGTVRPAGRLPVAVSRAYPKGHGLSLPA